MPETLGGNRFDSAMLCVYYVELNEYWFIFLKKNIKL